MATDVLQKAKRSSRNAGHEVTRRAQRTTAEMTPVEMALAAVGVAALAGICVAAFYYTPDLVRYMKIKRM